jgi:hypothetical protein
MEKIDTTTKTPNWRSITEYRPFALGDHFPTMAGWPRMSPQKLTCTVGRLHW